MDPEFQWEAASSDEEDERNGGALQSPWEFSSYLESAAEEHGRKNTTSVDAKISKALQDRPIDRLDQGDSMDGDGEDYTYVDEPAKQEVRKSHKKDVESSGGGDKPFFALSKGASFFANSFFNLKFSHPLLRACEALGYTKLTSIQAACILLALFGRDICGSALTGSEKTAAFTMPVLERLLFRPKRDPAIRVMIFTLARELAAQVHSMIEKLAQFIDIKCCLVVGGLSTKMQEAALRSMPDIFVATPGRMIDLLQNSQSVGLEDLAVLILDEADRLLDLSSST